MIFFDLDGTLLDNDAAVRAGVIVFLEAFRAEFSQDLESFLPRWEAATERHFQSTVSGRKESFWGQRRARMREIFGRDFSDEEADSRFKVYLAAYEAGWRLYPDVRPCLEALAGRRIGLISNGDGEQQRAKLQRLGLGDTFEVVVISREVDCAKPDRAIFDLAAKQANVAVGDCTYVGDRLEADALGSRDAGMKGIWLNRKMTSIAVPSGISVISELRELPSLLLAQD